jgi:hypothetical protein
LNITSDLALTIGAVTGVFIVLIMAVLVAALPTQKASATDLVEFQVKQCRTNSTCSQENVPFVLPFP